MAPRVGRRPGALLVGVSLLAVLAVLGIVVGLSGHRGGGLETGDRGADGGGAETVGVLGTFKGVKSPSTWGGERNALLSWMLGGPAAVVVFVDADTKAALDGDAGLRATGVALRVVLLDGSNTREPGEAPAVAELFRQAERTAPEASRFLYVNGDLILPRDGLHLLVAGQRALGLPALMMGTGGRTNCDISAEFAASLAGRSNAEFEAVIREDTVRCEQTPRAAQKDYFFWTRGYWEAITDGKGMPDIVIGRGFWDNYLAEVSCLRAAMVDMTPLLVIIHMNHDYSHVIASTAEGSGARAGTTAAPAKKASLKDVENSPHGRRNKALNADAIALARAGSFAHGWRLPLRRYCSGQLSAANYHVCPAAIAGGVPRVRRGPAMLDERFTHVTASSLSADKAPPTLAVRVLSVILGSLTAAAPTCGEPTSLLVSAEWRAAWAYIDGLRELLVRREPLSLLLLAVILLAVMAWVSAMAGFTVLPVLLRGEKLAKAR